MATKTQYINDLIKGGIIMSHIYSVNYGKTEVGLYNRPHESDLPYVVTINRGIFVAECSDMAEAYRYYNEVCRLAMSNM